MSVKDQAGLILRDVAKGLVSVVIPPTQKDEKPSEYLHMHYCEKCKGYHKAK